MSRARRSSLAISRVRGASFPGERGGELRAVARRSLSTSSKAGRDTAAFRGGLAGGSRALRSGVR